MDISTATYDITIVQGSEENDVPIVPTEDDYSPIILQGFTARCQIRPTLKSNTVLDDLTTENGRITITEIAGGLWQVTLLFPYLITSTYDFTNGVYQLELYSGVIPYRLLGGSVFVDREVVR